MQPRSAGEKTAIGQLLQSDAAWKEKYNELLRVNELLKSSVLDAPSLCFTKNVWRRMQSCIAHRPPNLISIKKLSGLSAFCLFPSYWFFYGFSQMGLTRGEESTLSKDLNKIDISKFFNNTWMNILMMVNIAIGLFLFYNYVTSKKKQFRSSWWSFIVSSVR